MDIQEDSQLSAYRERLLEALRHPSRQAREDPGLLQVFVNHECIGTLDCSHADPTLVYASHERPIHTVEIRTEAGLLVGSFCAQEVAAKAFRFPVGRHVIEMSVRTRLDGGTIRVRYQAAKGWRHRLHSAVASFMGGLPGLDQREHAWTRALAVTQAVLALAVLFLVADRVGDHAKSQAIVVQASPASIPSNTSQAISSEALDLQEQKLVRLMQAQEAALQTLQTQQEEIVQVSRTVEAVAKAQQQLRSNLLTVQQRGADSKGVTPSKLNNLLLAELRNAAAERKQMHQQIQELTAGKEALSSALVALETRNRVLEQNRPSQQPAGPKLASTPDPEKPAVAKATEGAPPSPTAPAQVAEAPRANLSQPFTFWVSFQDGTSEASIEQLIQEIHGRKGQVSAGWYNVEVTLPQPQPPDGFMESLRKAKIVKAVTTSRNIPPGQ